MNKALATAKQNSTKINKTWQNGLTGILSAEQIKLNFGAALIFTMSPLRYITVTYTVRHSQQETRDEMPKQH